MSRALNYLLKARPEAMQAYYDPNPVQFETEERVDLEYIEIRLDDIMQSIGIDEAAIRDFYDLSYAYHHKIIYFDDPNFIKIVNLICE